MDKFLFVLGSNFQLSIAELDHVLRHSRFKGRIVDYSATIGVVEFEKLHENEFYVDDLMELQFMMGGCQKIAKVYDFIPINMVKDAFPLVMDKYKIVEKNRTKIQKILENCIEEIFPTIKNRNIFYAVSIYPEFYDDEYYSRILVKHFLPFLNKKIMEILKEKGASKALYYKYPEEYIEKGTLNPIFPHILIKYRLFEEDRAEIIFGFTEEGIYIARTFTCDNPNFKKKIDEERPHKDFKSSISPKLAIIMLNFLNLFHERETKKILDPFMGNGTIPMFSILEDFQVYGTDKNLEKVNNTKRNIQWLMTELEEELPINLDEKFLQLDVKDLSKHFPSNFFDGICTEPELGPFFTTEPFREEIKELIENDLNQKYEYLFKEAQKILKNDHRLVITSPIFATIEGKHLQINVENIARKYNFTLIPMIDTNRIINKSDKRLQFQGAKFRTIIDAKKEQIIMRKIHVFEKRG